MYFANCLRVYRKKQLLRDSRITLFPEYLFDCYTSRRDIEMTLAMEEMFRLRMVCGEEIGFDELNVLTKYFADKYDSLNPLISTKCDMKKTNYSDETILMVSSRARCYIDIVKLLLAEKSIARQLIDGEDYYGSTALMGASLYGNMDAVNQLIQANCRIDPKTRSGETALMLASFFGYQDVVEKLIDACLRNGCSLDDQDNDGYTALMDAISGQGGYDAVRQLVLARCSLDVENKNKMIALMMRRGRGIRIKQKRDECNDCRFIN